MSLIEQTEAAAASTSHWTAAQIEALNARFDGQEPQELLSWTASTFGPSAVLTCSFGGASGMVLLDMVAQLGSKLSVVFLDTDLLFGETYALAKDAAKRYDIAIEWRSPTLTLVDQERQEGPELYRRDPDRCCSIRKVAPLARALQPYRAWISGIRRDQSATRAATPLLQWNERHSLLKISPLAGWSERDVWRYIEAHQVPYNPLLNQGYSSLGCAPCTRPANADDPRAGRWAGFAKVECGIHS